MNPVRERVSVPAFSPMSVVMLVSVGALSALKSQMLQPPPTGG